MFEGNFFFYIWTQYLLSNFNAARLSPYRGDRSIGVFRKREINFSRNQKRFKSICTSVVVLLQSKAVIINFAVWHRVRMIRDAYGTRTGTIVCALGDGSLAHPVSARRNGVVSLAAWRARARAHTAGRTISLAIDWRGRGRGIYA